MNNFKIFVNINIKLQKADIFINRDSNTEPAFSRILYLDNLIQLSSFEIFLKKTILETEKILNISFEKLYLMVEDARLNSIDISFKENFENKPIAKTTIEYLLQDLRQQFLDNHNDKIIAHMVIKKCKLDGEEYSNIPFEKKCKNFVLEISFIYLKKNLVSNLQELFKKYQIEIDKIICTNYAKSLLNIEVDYLSKAGIAVIAGNNLNEVNIVSKKTNKLGFFEKLFHIFT